MGFLPIIHSFVNKKYLVVYNVSYSGLGPLCGRPKSIEMITTLVKIFIYWEKLTLKIDNIVKYFGLMK